MNLSHFLAVIRARWLPALAVFLVVVAASIAYVTFATRIYAATASLLIDSKPDPVSAMLGGGTSPAVINTQIEIIRSDRVAARVVQNLKLADTADLKAAWERGGKSGGTLQEWLTNFIEAGLDVGVARPGSTVINITYRSADPRFAATVANAYVQAYLETSIELRVDPAKQYSGFFTDQQKAARDSLEAAQNKLSAFQKEKQMIGTDDRFDLELSRLNLLTQNLVAIQQARVDASTRLGQTGNATQMSEVLGNGTVSGLKSELSSAELKLQELSSRFGDKNPQVQDARAAVAELKNKVARATNDVTGAVGIDARVSRARESELQAAIDAQRTKVLALKETRDQGAVLQRDVDNAQHSYDLVYNRANQTNLESQNRQSNATVISQASVPGEPSSPKVVANLLMGVVGALVLALGTAILIEQFDKRIRTTADAIDFLGLPVIGIMPSPSMNRRLRGQMALIQERVISGRRLAGPDKGQA
ncbi:MAG: Wzz/FepE/Etk N-terminal domain-containing protein [Betaproteobacteria bacterium]